MLYYIGMIFAGIGAGALLLALTAISAIIGGLINAMIVLIAGPVVDRLVRKPASRTAVA